MIFDFAELCTIKDYQEKIGDQLKDIDIAMLFLNAGYAAFGAFKDITNDDVEKTTAVNILQPIYTAKVLVDQMIARDHKGAIVVTSSIASYRVLPGMTNYSASKSFASFLAQGLNYELGDKKIDVLDWKPGEVETKMIGGKKAAGLCVTTDVAVKGMLRHLGKETWTNGCTTHAMHMGILSPTLISMIQGSIFADMQSRKRKDS